MPDSMRLGTALAQFRCNDRSEMIPPASDYLVRNHNSALGEQILDVTKAEREPEIEPDRLVNDLRREPISGVADFRQAANAVTTPSEQLQVAIMGGGIGGLTAALALRARGLKVAIFEQAVELGEISTSKTPKEAPVTNSPV
jgi:hypothetical protein